MVEQPSVAKWFESWAHLTGNALAAPSGVPDQLEALRQVMTAVTATDSLDCTLETILDAVLEATGLEGGTICLVGQDEVLNLRAERNTSAETRRDLMENEVKVGECLCGECARDMRPLILWDERAVQGYASRESLRDENIRFHAAFPAPAHGRSVGVVCIFTRTDAKPTRSSLDLVEVISNHVGIAIERASMHEALAVRAGLLEEDLRERVRELESMNVRLQEVDRLKNVFVASMSHELRTPLNSVIGFSQTLLQDMAGPLNDEQRKQLEMINSAGRRLLALVEDIMDVAAIEAGRLDLHIEVVDMHSLLDDVSRAHRLTAEAKGLAFEITCDDCSVSTDRRRLWQCMDNLIGNAVRYTSEGGIRVVCSHDGVAGCLRVSVVDSGIGIDSSEIGAVFEPFTRGGSVLLGEVPGKGLGLYLTRRLVEQALGGRLSVESSAGVGSTFTIEFPSKC